MDYLKFLIAFLFSINAQGAYTNSVTVSNFPATQVVSGTVTVPGVATSANQVTANASLSSIDSKLNSPLVISGDVSVVSSALPSGASTSVNQTTANSFLSSIDTKLNSPLIISGDVSTGLLQPLTDTQLRASPIQVSGDVSVISSALPLGAATSAHQVTANASLSSIDSKLTAPLVISGDVSVISSALPSGAATAANQSTANSSLSSIDSKLTAPLVISGDVSVVSSVLPSGAATEATLSNLNSKAIEINTADVSVTNQVMTTDRMASGDITAACSDANINSCSASSFVQIDSDGAGTVIAQHLGTWSAVVVFDVSYDNGVTWDMQSSIDISVNDPTNNLRYFIKWGSSLAADRWAINPAGAKLTRLRATTFTSGTINVILTASAASFYQNVPLRKHQTYSASVINLALETSPTDIFTLTANSSTKVVTVTDVGFTCVKTTTGSSEIVILKRSTVNSGGTSTDLTEAKNDEASSAATATALAYTADPTLGTLLGNIRVARLVFPTSNDNVNEALKTFTFGSGFSQGIVLRQNQVFAVNLNGAAIVGGFCTIYVQWTEE